GEIEVPGGEAGDPIDLSVPDAPPELGRVDERSEASPPRVEAGSQQASPCSRGCFEPEPVAERVRQLAQERRWLPVEAGDVPDDDLVTGLTDSPGRIPPGR